MKTIQLFDTEPVYYDGGHAYLWFRNQNGEFLLLTYEDVIELILYEDYTFIKFYS
jgi:hypothetical protein